ncbi:adaptin N terminal region-domain-containing protein [Hyaloraphidium curvatum]|nr:adaptin N terminal region-domain-containing protein [Hyaloraphidium curvatum]
MSGSGAAAMPDAKYFQRGKIQELRAELAADKRDTKHAKKRVALKKVVANMTMGNDMSPLFSDVLGCMQIPILEIKKMVYLYLIHYSKSKPDLAVLAINAFIRDSIDPNPLIRALAVRTMSYIQVDRIIDSLTDPLRTSLRDSDPYVRKTAAICVAKVFMHNPTVVEREGFLDLLLDLLNDSNATVVANAVAALTEISDRSEGFEFTIDIAMANKLLTAINDCSEWGQVYILEGLLFYVPQESQDAELLAERVLPRLQHANSAVVLSAVRVILYLMNYMSLEENVDSLYRKIGPPLGLCLAAWVVVVSHSDLVPVTLLHNSSEVQYVALRNILLIIQKRPDFLKNEMKVFFCKYNDPIYVKLAKLEIMIRLANDANVAQVLSELREYASEVDVEFVRKSVRAIGRCAIKIDSSADKCIQTLLDLIQTKVNYVVQEAIVDIFRKYPNRYESIISTLCENLDSLDEPEAKASMIWIIGHYADRIENAHDLLAQFLETFREDPAEVQLTLLTAVVKLFVRRPTVGQDLVPKMLKWATEDLDNPDVRDRAFIYWRLLSTNPVAAKAVLFADMPTISTETDNLEPSFLDDLLLYVSSLSSVYHKLPTTFIGGIKARKLAPSRALNLMYRAAATLRFDGPIGSAPAASSALYGGGSTSNPYQTDGLRPYGGDNVDEGDEGDQDIGGQDGAAARDQTYLSSMMGSMDLGSPAARGLEITGTFARRQGQMFMDLEFANRGVETLSDFAIQFNKNSFGVAPGGILDTDL